MAKTQTTTSDNLKRLMWDRLSQSPEKLDLDMRADEEPEDAFVLEDMEQLFRHA